MAKTQTENVDSKNGTAIKPCACKSTYQDKHYGKDKRVHNIGKKKTTCTVCGTAKAE